MPCKIPGVYKTAHERLERFCLRDTERIGEFGRTLLLDHGVRTQRATLLFHGMSSSPRQFIAIAQALYERGHNVFVPRLPRHGYGDRMSEALATMNAAQLRACAADSLEIAAGLGERVCVAGFSLGGLLAAHLGQFHAVDRVVAIAPFLGVAFVPGALRGAIVRWMLRRPNRFYWWNPFLRGRNDAPHGYPRYATHAVAQALTLATELTQAAEREEPRARELVMVLNRSEPTINNASVAHLVKRWCRQRPGCAHLYHLSGLPIAHDIIEPQHNTRVAQQVAPVLIGLIDS